MTQKDLINETIRLCRNLTQLIYDKDNDKIIKGLIHENLKEIHIDFSLPDVMTKSGCERKILKLACIFCECEKDSEDNKKVKKELLKALAELSSVINKGKEASAIRLSENKLKNMLAVM